MQIIIELLISHGEKLSVIFRAVVKSLIAVVLFYLSFLKIHAILYKASMETTNWETLCWK